MRLEHVRTDPGALAEARRCSCRALAGVRDLGADHGGSGHRPLAVRTTSPTGPRAPGGEVVDARISARSAAPRGSRVTSARAAGRASPTASTGSNSGSTSVSSTGVGVVLVALGRSPVRSSIRASAGRGSRSGHRPARGPRPAGAGGAARTGAPGAGRASSSTGSSPRQLLRASCSSTVDDLDGRLGHVRRSAGPRPASAGPRARAPARAPGLLLGLERSCSASRRSCSARGTGRLGGRRAWDAGRAPPSRASRALGTSASSRVSTSTGTRPSASGPGRRRGRRSSPW